MKLARKIDKCIDRFLLSAQLDKIDISFDHGLRYAHRLRRVDIIEIDDAVEPAMRQIGHDYSCKRARVGLSSNVSEDITRSTNPVSYFPARNSALRMMAL